MSRLLRAVYWLGMLILDGFAATWVIMGGRSVIGTVVGIILVLLAGFALWQINSLARAAERDEKPKTVTINIQGTDGR